MYLQDLLAHQSRCPSGFWNALQVNSFQQLLATRVGFAAAQATQNPVCFSLIPELFPKSKTTAMAFYNSAIYMGRALSFAAVIVAGQLGIKHSELGVTMVSPCQLAAFAVWDWSALGLPLSVV